MYNKLEKKKEKSKLYTRSGLVWGEFLAAAFIESAAAGIFRVAPLPTAHFGTRLHASAPIYTLRDIHLTESLIAAETEVCMYVGRVSIYYIYERADFY